MKKRLLSLLLASSLCVGLSACDGQIPDSNSTQTAGTENEYQISVILKTTAAEYWQYVQAGCKAFDEEHDNVTVTVKGPPSETSYEEQLNMIQTDLANSDIDALVISPLQGDMVANLIKGTDKTVVAVDTDFKAVEKISFIGTGNEAAAKLGGEQAVKEALSRGWETVQCIEIAGVEGDATNSARLAGYRAGVETAGGEFLEAEVQYADAVADKAVTAMEGIMAKYPEGIAIICAHNDDMAIAAAKTAQRNPKYQNTVFLGFNGDQSACESMLNGVLTMSVAQDAYGMGYKSVEACVESLNGETLADFIDSGATVITKSNAQEQIDQLREALAD